MSPCYSQLTHSDRRRLYHLKERKVPIGEIARQLGRHRSTNYRELKRNTFHDSEFPEYSGYFDTIADDISKERRRRLRKLRRYPKPCDQVIECLQAKWSPEQIAGRLAADGVSLVRVGQETIIASSIARKTTTAACISICQSAGAGVCPAAHANPATVTSQRTIEYRKDLILLAIALSLVTGGAGHRYTVIIKNRSRHSRPIMDKIITAFWHHSRLSHAVVLPSIVVRSSPD